MQDRGIRFALDAYETAHVGEGAAAGADVVVGFVGFDVLIFIVEDDVAARDGFVGLVVVFDVVGAEALIAVVNVDGAFGGGDVALAGLRADRGEVGDAAFGGLTDFLGARQRGAEECDGMRTQREAPSEETASGARGNSGHWDCDSR